METWGFCRGCDRWFYCGRVATSAACPVCGGTAEAIEERASAS
jgi:rRNA maturation endonuclease Nob1